MNTEARPIVFGAEAIPMLVEERGAAALWIDDAGSRSWDDFGRLVADARFRCAAAGIAPGEVVVTPGEASLDSLAWLFAAAEAGAVVAPLRLERREEAAAWTQSFRVHWAVAGDRLERIGGAEPTPAAARLFSALRERRHPGLVLATGGTTGTPKLVLHDLAGLLAAVPLKAGRPWRTLPLLRFDHIGGLDVAWRALAGGQVLVAPPPEVTPEAVGAAVARHGVEVLPATPSFLNLFLIAEVPRRFNLASLRLVAYGAEPMPAGLLGRLREALPAVQFVQRFGTSETGALPLDDAAAGLALRKGRPGYEWKIVDHELWVRSPTRALGYLAGGTDGFEGDGWFRTGDLAGRNPDGTLAVLGRKEDLINVGGEKVLPAEVEAALRAHPLVADCRVGSIANGVLGRVVAAEIVWRGPERDVVQVKRILHEFAARTLSRHKLPVVVRLVDAIPSTRNLKRAHRFDA